MKSFDLAATHYDEQFTDTSVGRAQRDQVWKQIGDLHLTKGLDVLEINCGTGNDAKKWTELGFNVWATDLSPKMVEIAKQKNPSIPCATLDINKLGDIETKKDIIFSNFGGLNCISPNELERFFQNAFNILNPGGKLIIVVMGKKCIWDNLFLFLKRKWSDMGRRNTNTPLHINVDGNTVSTWYFAPKELEKMASKYTNMQTKPIGLHVPPSYLASFFEKKQFLLSYLKFLDKLFSLSILSNYADHYFVSFDKK